MVGSSLGGCGLVGVTIVGVVGSGFCGCGLVGVVREWFVRVWC